MHFKKKSAVNPELQHWFGSVFWILELKLTKRKASAHDLRCTRTSGHKFSAAKKLAAVELRAAFLWAGRMFTIKVSLLIVNLIAPHYSKWTLMMSSNNSLLLCPVNDLPHSIPMTASYLALPKLVQGPTQHQLYLKRSWSWLFFCFFCERLRWSAKCCYERWVFLSFFFFNEKYVVERLILSRRHLERGIKVQLRPGKDPFEASEVQGVGVKCSRENARVWECACVWNRAL